MVAGHVVLERKLLVLRRLVRALSDVGVPMHGSTGSLGLRGVLYSVEDRADCIRVKPCRRLSVG